MWSQPEITMSAFSLSAFVGVSGLWWLKNVRTRWTAEENGLRNELAEILREDITMRRRVNRELCTACYAEGRLMDNPLWKGMGVTHSIIGSATRSSDRLIHIWRRLPIALLFDNPVINGIFSNVLELLTTEAEEYVTKYDNESLPVQLAQRAVGHLLPGLGQKSAFERAREAVQEAMVATMAQNGRNNTVTQVCWRPVLALLGLAQRSC